MLDRKNVDVCAQGPAIAMRMGHIYSTNPSIGQPFPSTIYLLIMLLFTA